ncbi:MAG: Hint domain-containing protein [Pseudomonadota bacterium]
MNELARRRHPRLRVGMEFDREYAVLAGFCPSATVMSDDGPLPLEWLSEGDRVLTRDSGYQPVLWIERTRMTRRMLTAVPELAPVQIAPGTFGATQPDRTLNVSPSQLVFVERDPTVRGGQGVLLPANELGSAAAAGSHPRPATYVSILLPGHHLMQINGVWMGSLFLADLAADLLPSDPMRAALDDEVMQPAAPIISRQDAARFLVSWRMRRSA